jgi:predicted nucleotidyltransferase
LAAFGSRARQQALPARDIDVAVILIWAEEFVRLCERVHERRH